MRIVLIGATGLVGSRLVPLLDLLRPGLLRGPRGGDRRRGERLAIALSPLTDLLLRGRYDRFAAIDAADVA